MWHWILTLRALVVGQRVVYSLDSFFSSDESSSFTFLSILFLFPLHHAHLFKRCGPSISWLRSKQKTRPTPISRVRDLQNDLE